MNTLGPIDNHRRMTLKWLAVGLGTAPLLTGCCNIIDPLPKSQLLGVPKPVTGVPYGTDPDLIDPLAPWELTMTKPQLELAATLCDFLVPAMDMAPSGRELGLHLFVDEWVSSPYAHTQKDREPLFALLEWFEREARDAGSTSFASATASLQEELMDRIAWRGRIDRCLSEMAEAFDQFRKLAVSAYFASEQGGRWLGYRGNEPSGGDYEGPSAEAQDHLQTALKKLDLAMPEGL